MLAYSIATYSMILGLHGLSSINIGVAYNVIIIL